MPTQRPTIRLREHGWVAFIQDHDIEADSLNQAVQRIGGEYDDAHAAEPIWDVQETSYYEDEPFGEGRELQVVQLFMSTLTLDGLHDETRAFVTLKEAQAHHENYANPTSVDQTIVRQRILVQKVNHAHPDAT